jgi:hypothetical protein
MVDASAAARVARLRQIAAEEIARHRERQGFLGAALEGSVATGAVWPSSDVDFSIVPRPEQTAEQLIEWEQQEALPFAKEHADRRIHIDVCGQQDGIPWHKHLTDSRALLDLLESYPTSFIRPAEGPFDPAAHWFLDGLAVMQVVDDPEGLLGETRRFVAAHRFAGEVWEGRRCALLRELRRTLDLAQEAMGWEDADAAYQLLSGDAGFAAVAVQLWLEGARRICSSKEQDGRLAEVAAAAGCPEAHALYHRALAVDPVRAGTVVPLLRLWGERAASLYQMIGALSLEGSPDRREAAVWGAFVSHLAETLSLAPGRGHPAHLYQSLRSLLFWTSGYPARIIAELRAKDGPGLETLDRIAAETSYLAAQIGTVLLDPLSATSRVQGCLTAAEELLALTSERP